MFETRYLRQHSGAAANVNVSVFKHCKWNSTPREPALLTFCSISVFTNLCHFILHKPGLSWNETWDVVNCEMDNAWWDTVIRGGVSACNIIHKDCMKGCCWTMKALIKYLWLWNLTPEGTAVLYIGNMIPSFILYLKSFQSHWKYITKLQKILEE